MKNRMCALTLLLFLIPVATHAGEFQGRSVTVIGVSEVKVVPNEVVIRLGVITTDNNVERVKQDNDRKAAEIINIAAKNGVSEKDIKTEYMHVSPNYVYDKNRQKLIGYTARNNISFRYKDLDNIQVLMGAMLRAGGNVVDGIYFQHSEIEKYRDQALVEALKSAKGKAEIVVKETGMILGKVRNIKEEPPTVREVRTMMASAAGGESGAGSGIAPGQIEVRATVTVTYDME